MSNDMHVFCLLLKFDVMFAVCLSLFSYSNKDRDFLYNFMFISF